MHSPILIMLRRNSSPFIALLLGGALALAACGEDPKATETAGETSDPTGDATEGTDSASSTSTSTAGLTSGSSAGSATGTTGTGSTGGETETGCSFISCKDGGGTSECDIWGQDCPDDQKCMPFADDGSNAWNATKCTPLDPNAALIGDVCEGGGVSGIDNCELGSMCYYVDSETGEGVCVPFCIGSEEDPSCADLNDKCSISNMGSLILCRKTCDPLLQDCSGSAACLPASGSNDFVCIVDASGEEGQAGDPCEYLNSCDPGLYCVEASLVPDCVASGCCTEFCDYSDPNKDDACSQKDLGMSCELYFIEGEAPPGFEGLGGCILPP